MNVTTETWAVLLRLRRHVAIEASRRVGLAGFSQGGDVILFAHILDQDAGGRWRERLEDWKSAW